LPGRVIQVAGRRAANTSWSCGVVPVRPKRKGAERPHLEGPTQVLSGGEKGILHQKTRIAIEMGGFYSEKYGSLPDNVGTITITGAEWKGTGSFLLREVTLPEDKDVHCGEEKFFSTGKASETLEKTLPWNACRSKKRLLETRKSRNTGRCCSGYRGVEM